MTTLEELMRKIDALIWGLVMLAAWSVVSWAFICHYIEKIIDRLDE